MTLEQAIRNADSVKPNAFSDEVKTLWLNECEGMVQTEVMLIPNEAIVEYSWEADRDRELLVGKPFHKMYAVYIQAMIDFAYGEYDKYTNTIAVFNTYFDEYMRWYAERNPLADRRVEE